MRVKLKRFQNYGPFESAVLRGRGREIQYKSICPADFDMSPSKFLGAAYFSWDPSLVSLSNKTAGRGGQQNARV